MYVWKGRCSLVASRRIPYQPAERWGHPARPLRTLTLLRAPLHAGERRVRQDARRGASRATSDGAAPPDSLRTGKITGNFRHFRPFRCVPSAFSVGLRCNTSALRMIPCSSLEQGIRLVEQGISSNETADSPILLGVFGSRIPLARFPPKRGGRRRSV